MPEAEEISKLLEDVRTFPFEIRYRLLEPKIKEMSSSEFSEAMDMVSDFERAKMLKIRCETEDKIACAVLGAWVEGEPEDEKDTKIARIRKKGLKRLWKEDANAHAGRILVELGHLTAEDFNKRMDEEAEIVRKREEEAAEKRRLEEEEMKKKLEERLKALK